MEQESPLNNSPIAIIGNLNIDLTIRKLAQLPEWGREAIGENYDHVAAGQAAKTGMALAHLGHVVRIIANVGEDTFGREILGTLNSNGVDISSIEITLQTRTGLSVAIVRPDGERAFISDTACLKHFNLELVKRHWHNLEGCKLVCVLGSFFIPGLPLPDISFLIQKLKKENKIIMLDTGWDSDNWQAKTLHDLKSLLQLTDIFIPNEDEAHAITGLADPQQAAQALSEMSPGIIIIKLGSQGCFFHSRDLSMRVPGFKVNAIDTVGAGDVFNAGFIHGYTQNWAIEECLRFGNALSSIYISRLNDRFAGAEEVVKILECYTKLVDND